MNISPFFEKVIFFKVTDFDVGVILGSSVSHATRGFQTHMIFKSHGVFFLSLVLCGRYMDIIFLKTIFVFRMKIENQQFVLLLPAKVTCIPSLWIKSPGNPFSEKSPCLAQSLGPAFDVVVHYYACTRLTVCVGIAALHRGLKSFSGGK